MASMTEARRLIENPCVSPELVGGDVEDVQWMRTDLDET
jgi:hypothetical protein